MLEKAVLVLFKTLKAVLCICVAFLFPEQSIHWVILEGALASLIASVLQWEKLSPGRQCDLLDAAHCQYFVTLSFVLCCIHVLKHPSYKLKSLCDRSSALVQGLFAEVVCWLQ